jgi:hypothetical protein
MSLTNINKDTEILGGATRGRRGWRTCAALCCVLMAATAVTSTPGTAEAATAPSAQLSFSPAAIKAGSQPEMTFMSQNVPSGSLLYLQESPDRGQQWQTVDKTTATQGTAKLAALPKGVYQFRIVIAENGTALAESGTATLTVTGSGGATPALARSGSHIPWLDIIVKPVWDAIIAAIVTWVISLF